MASLTLVVQDREVRTFELTAAVTTIGRAQDNDIVINNLALSRRHAEVHRRGPGFEVTDRGSQNGVFVNDERIEGPRPLRDADVVTLGTYRFVFKGDPETPSPDLRPGRKRPRGGSAGSEQPTPPPARVEPATPPPDLEPASAPMAVLTYNELELQRLPLEEEECLIGRAKECDIQIAERRLSRRHCLLFRDDDGRWMVKDLGSQNGTYINRRKVRDAQLLNHGDVLNFAEYAVLFLSDAEAYDEVDVTSEPPLIAPRPMSGIEREQTEFPEAYEPSELVSAAPEPVVSQPPRSRRPRPPRSTADRPARSNKVQAPSVRKPAAPKPKPSRAKVRAGGVEVRGLTASETGAFEGVDVPDLAGERPRPDPSLDDWYASRDGDEYEEEPSVLLERSKSSMSQLLSTMMVDKRELDRNLEVARRARRYTVRVEWGSETLFDGPLDREVTVLGTDAESDLPLRGRYVSGRHSLLVRVRDSLLLVRLGSSSAARVNGQPRLQAFLKGGDVIQIDETKIVVNEPRS